MPAFTIFIDQWPWIAAYALIALGTYMLIFGRKHFPRVTRLFSALFVFSVVSCLLSINGYFERKIEEGPSGLILFLIILILLMGTIVGFISGHLMSTKFALIFMCVVNATVISVMFFSFLISFTGTWIVLVISLMLLIGVCVYLPLKFETQMQIQTTSFLGAWMLTRGVSLMVGGYPNEMQLITWMNNGYTLSTKNVFFIYIIATVIIFLIG